MPLCKTEKGLLADPFSVLQSDRAKPASEKPQVLSDALRGKQGDALRGKQGDALRGKQGDALRGKQGDALRSKQSDTLRSKQGDALQSKQSDAPGDQMHGARRQNPYLKIP